MGYTTDGIMAQIYVAFGQGTGAVRVSQEACLALRERYHGYIDASIIESWDRIAVQILERMRAIGRLVAAQAALAGETAVAYERVAAAIDTVERVSATPICPSSRQRDDREVTIARVAADPAARA